MVVSLNSTNYDVCLILIDNGSLTDVLFYDAFSHIGKPPEHLERLDSSFMGFTRDTVPIEGVITLPIAAGQSPQ